MLRINILSRRNKVGSIIRRSYLEVRDSDERSDTTLAAVFRVTRLHDLCDPDKQNLLRLEVPCCTKRPCKIIVTH